MNIAWDDRTMAAALERFVVGGYRYSSGISYRYSTTCACYAARPAREGMFSN